MLPRIKSVEKGIKMKREELEKLGLSKEQIDQIMDANGKDINESKKREEEKVKSLELLQNELTKVTNEFSNYKKSKMTEDEKQKSLIQEENARYEKALNEAEKAKSDYSRLIKESKVRETLGSFGNDEEIKTLIPSFIADTEEESISRATIFKDYVEKQKATAATAAVEEAAKNIPNPKGEKPVPKTEPYEVKTLW